MTRKRYMKLLMAHGVSRNEAEIRAKKVRDSGVSYRWHISMERFSFAMRQLGKSVVKGAVSVKNFADPLQKWEGKTDA